MWLEAGITALLTKKEKEGDSIDVRSLARDISRSKQEQDVSEKLTEALGMSRKGLSKFTLDAAEKLFPAGEKMASLQTSAAPPGAAVQKKPAPKAAGGQPLPGKKSKGQKINLNGLLKFTAVAGNSFNVGERETVETAKMSKMK
eukprot:Hpha_TRINITY_DN15392_c3_g4::TRINITY_DN15392_c3_g4_i4::g.90568::m.90568